MISEETSLNNAFNELTLKYFSLNVNQIWTKKQNMLQWKGFIQETQKGGSSPFNKNTWVTCEWSICRRERAVSSRQNRHLNIGNNWGRYQPFTLTKLFLGGKNKKFGYTGSGRLLPACSGSSTRAQDMHFWGDGETHPHRHCMKCSHWTMSKSSQLKSPWYDQLN